MNQTIVENAIKDFTTKLNINSSEFNTVLNNFLWESIRDLREEDLDLYEEIRSHSTISQMQLLEYRLENEFIDLEEINERVSETFITAFQKAVELNNIDESTDYDIDTAKTLLEDTMMFLINEGIWKDMYNGTKEKVVNAVKATVDRLVKWSPTLVAGGLAAAAVTLPIGFMGSMLALLVLLVMCGVMSKLGVNVSRDQISLFKDVSSLFGKIGKYIKDADEHFQFRWNILYKNEERCYQKAGLNVKDIGLRMLGSVKEGSLIRQILFFDDEKKLDKLRNCYLENFLDRISIFFELYFDCLRKTGKWNEVREMSDDKFIEMFQIKGGLYPMCDEYRTNAVKAIRTYEDLVDFVFEKTPEKKSQWKLLLNRYILDMKASKEKMLRKMSEPQSPFVSSKFQRLGRGTNVGGTE